MRSFDLARALFVLVPVAGACGPSSSSGDCADNLLAGDLVITEVFADAKAPPGGSGTDEGKEWFEIYNATDRPVELKGLTIVHSRPDGSRAKSHVMKDVTVAPGQFFTLGNSAADLLPAYIDYGYSADLGDMFNTDGGQLRLSCGSSEIDSAIYESVKEGRSRQLTASSAPDYTINDDQLNWCEANGSEFETANFGTPGSENDCTPVVIGQCNDGGTMRDTVPPMEGDLVITEVMPNPAAVSDTDGEWFEVHAVNAVDLNGMGLDRAGDSSNPTVLASADCLHVPAGGYAIFAKNADMGMNGGLPAASILGTFSFALVDGSVATPGDVRILMGTTVLDAITWTSTRSGASHQLDPTKYDPIVNDEPTTFCDGTTAFGGGDLGTPGAANVACPVVVGPGMCLDNGTPRAIVKPAAGALVITEVMVNPKIESPVGHEWFEITNTGGTAFDVNGLGLDRAGDSRMPDVIGAADCKIVPPGGFALFARSSDPASNAMLPAVDATFGFSMPNTGGDVQVVDGTTVLDKFTYGSVSAAMYDGFSLSLDPDSFTASPDDVIDTPPLGTWCLGAAPYGDQTNQGTPKAANAQCP